MLKMRNILVLLLVVLGAGVLLAQDGAAGDTSTLPPIPTLAPLPAAGGGSTMPVMPTFPPPPQGEPRQPIFGGTPQPIPPEVYIEMTAWYDETFGSCGEDCIMIGSGDWSGITMSDNMPQSLDELLTLYQNSELTTQLSLTSLGSLMREPSQEAYTAIVGFANVHLGKIIDPTYAQKVRTGIINDGTIPPSLTSQLSPEAQALLNALEGSDLQGASYYALLPDGFGIVVSAEDCTGRNCTVDADTLQFTIESASMGAFVAYRQGNVTSPEAAFSAVINAYPILRTYSLQPVPVEVGYAYSAVDYNVSGGKGYYAGVYNTGNSAIVYIVAAIGEGYLSLGALP
jgi:hypothetical protein